MAILPNVNELSREQLIAALLAAQAAPARKLTCKVSEKGAMSLYGMGRFPVTLYAGQWERLFAAKAEIEAFLKANASLLAVKA